jgi:putative cell wall-binding protein
MDSGVLDYGPDGALDAFLTVGAGLAGPASDPYSYRGGDLEQWRSTDDGATWAKARTLKKADPANGIVYNDPQTVSGYSSTGSRVLFGEWDNDAGNFVRKVFLWGPNGFRGREFFPTVKRLAGADRYEAASAMSREGFPSGSDTVVIASGEIHADALAGAPLARAYHAPLLLVRKGVVPASIRTEIVRLKARTVIVLGGTGTVSAATAKALKVGSVATVRRIAGADRYAVAAAIASELATVAGRPGGAFVVSGTAWADALSAASVAAARGWPVLLVGRGRIPKATSDALASLAVTGTIVVGGPATVPNSVLAHLPHPVRISGADRYAVSAAMAEYGLDGGPAFPQTLRTDRIMIASGRVFPDALAGSVLAARSCAPLVLTDGARLSSATNSFLRRRAYRVTRCYVLGGTGTIAVSTAASVADALRVRQSQ